MNFRNLTFVFVILFCFAIGDCRLCADDGPPNFMIVLVDDLGFSDLGCYGSEIETPNLDRLAADGLRFTQFYNTGRCWPTRASILTGYYAQQVRRDKLPDVNPSGMRAVRPEWAKLIPDRLKPAGYKSYHTGKWHVDSMPSKTGFDHSYYLGDQARFFSPQRIWIDGKKQPAVKRDSGYYATTAIADRTIEQLAFHKANHREKPFFHYLAFTAPHFPLHALPEDYKKYENRYSSGWNKIRNQRWKKIRKLGLIESSLSQFEREQGPPYSLPDQVAKFGDGEVTRPLEWERLTDSQKRFQAMKMALHAAMIDRIDKEFGRVIDYLKKSDQFDDTLILFLSDNGASAELMVRDDGHDPTALPGSAATHYCLGPGWSTACNAPFRKHKTWVHEGGIRTPMIAHWPKCIKSGGKLRSTPAHVIDIVPTFLELSGAEPKKRTESEPDFAGKSLVPAIEKDVAIERDCLWWLHEGHKAIRVGNWKLVATSNGPWELYDLEKYASETKNRAGEMPDKVSELTKKWKSVVAEFKKHAGYPAKEKSK